MHACMSVSLADRCAEFDIIFITFNRHSGGLFTFELDAIMIDDNETFWGNM